MAVMDYSLVQRIIDGTGQILDTTPGSPDSGSYVTEAQLRDWIKAGILFSGYYYNGNFYSDSGHTSPLAKVEGALYVDKTNSNKALYVCLSSTYQSLTEEAQVQAIIDGLNDGTIVPLKAKQDQNGNVIDTTYETKADANDLKNALTSVDHRVQNLESAKGDYVAVDSTKGVITTPSGKGKWAVVEKLRGVSRAKSQLGTLFTTEETWTSSVPEQLFSFFPHKYLCFFQYKFNTLNQSFRFRFNASEWTINDTISASDLNWHTYAKIADETHTLTSRIQFRDPTFDSSSIQLYKLNVVDLTLYFGAGNEPTLAQIQTYYPWLLEPSDYGQSLVDSVYEGVKSVGVNIWDEEWEVGRIASSSGINADTGYDIRSKYYIPVFPSTTYYFLVPPTGAVFFYDYSKNFISTTGSMNSGVFSTPSNCVFIRFCTYSGSGHTTYNHDIQICLNSYADKTEYHAHMESTLSLPSPITLRSAGTVAEEFDLKTGEKTKNVDNKNGTELSWTWYGQTNLVFAQVLGAKIGNAQFICNLPYQQTQGATGMIDKACGFGGNNDFFYIRDTSLTQAQLTAVAQSLNIDYELATPTTEQLDPIQNPTILTESGGTISAQTEEPIDGNFSVGFITL